MTTPNTPATTNEDAELMPMESVDRDVLKELQSYAEAWGAAASISEQLARTDFAGPFKGKPADMAAAILKGATIGIPPADIGKAIARHHAAAEESWENKLLAAIHVAEVISNGLDLPAAASNQVTHLADGAVACLGLDLQGDCSVLFGRIEARFGLAQALLA